MPRPAVAVLSDIHGNRWALEAVLDDIRRRGIRAMVNLGDCLYGPLDPAGTARMLMGLDMPTVRGNEDRIIAEEAGPHPGFALPALCAGHGCGPSIARWLETLPATAVLHEEFFLCHGTPERDDDYLVREVTAGSMRPAAAGGDRRRLESVAQPVVLYGHDHLPALLGLPDGRLLVNPGSVGLPAYRDDLPFPTPWKPGRRMRATPSSSARRQDGGRTRRRCLRLAERRCGGREERPPRLGRGPGQRLCRAMLLTADIRRHPDQKSVNTNLLPPCCFAINFSGARGVYYHENLSQEGSNEKVEHCRLADDFFACGHPGPDASRSLPMKKRLW